MGKSCKNCKYYNYEYKYCYEKMSYIIDKMGATYCKTYDEKRNLTEELIKCMNCANLNKYGWCYVKKKCFNETEKEKPRKCMNFQTRRKKRKNIKKM